MRLLLVSVLMVSIPVPGMSQGLLSDIISGALINPEVGVFAWYELKDAETGKKFFMRQAIVGTKEIKGKTGYYLETEIVPEVGFPIVYRMLLTGPASAVENVHEIMVREGSNPAEKLPLDVLKDTSNSSGQSARESKGIEQVATPAGDIEAEHFVVVKGAEKTELWVNDAIRPMGIVKMITPEGELVLIRHGKGSVDAESAIDKTVQEGEPGTGVTVRVEQGPKKNFKGRTAKP